MHFNLLSRISECSSRGRDASEVSPSVFIAHPERVSGRTPECVAYCLVNFPTNPVETSRTKGD